MKKKIFVFFILMIGIISLSVPVYAYKQTLSGGASRSYQSGTLYNGFNTNSNVTMGTIFTNYKVTHEGHSYSRWTGYNPYNADKIIQHDNFYWNGIGGLSLDVGTSGVGIGISSDSKSVTFSLEVQNSRRIDHYYSGVKGNRWIIHGTGQTITTTYQFGTTFISINASDSNVVW